MEDQVPANRLYVGNLPWSTDVDELRAIFSSCGAITHVDIPKGRQGRSRGYGIVEYSSAAEAQAAIAQLEGARPPRFSFPYSFARIGVSASAWGSRARANANAIRAPPIRAGRRRCIDRTTERPDRASSSSCTLVPIRPRSRGERRFLRTFRSAPNERRRTPPHSSALFLQATPSATAT